MQQTVNVGHSQKSFTYERSTAKSKRCKGVINVQSAGIHLCPEPVAGRMSVARQSRAYWRSLHLR